jgi:GntR family transcriptional regulator
MIVMALEDRAARIRHDSATPVTVQVAADIEADIDAGRLAPDTRPPSEAELAEQYGVARVTVRRAISLLRDRGKVVTVHDRGSYVTPQLTAYRDKQHGLWRVSQDDPRLQPVRHEPRRRRSHRVHGHEFLSIQLRADAFGRRPAACKAGGPMTVTARPTRTAEPSLASIAVRILASV